MYQREFFFFGSFFLFASLICFTPSSHSLCFPLRGKRSLVISARLRVFGCFAPFALRKFASEQKEKMNKKIFSTSIFQSKQRKKYFGFLICPRHASMNGTSGWKPQPTVIFSFRKNEKLRLHAVMPDPREKPEQKPQTRNDEGSSRQRTASTAPG